MVTICRVEVNIFGYMWTTLIVQQSSTKLILSIRKSETLSWETVNSVQKNHTKTDQHFSKGRGSVSETVYIIVREPQLSSQV